MRRCPFVANAVPCARPRPRRRRVLRRRPAAEGPRRKGPTGSRSTTRSSRRCCAKIEAAGAYDIPDLNLKKDDELREHLRGRRALRGHEAVQGELPEPARPTGAPGRAKPEPEGLESVKVGFIGPIMPTVSVATGGKSHEEALGIPMLQGSRLAIEEWNARGGYLKRKIPFELVVSQRQRPLGLLGQRDHQAGLHGRRLGDPRHDRRREQPHRDPRRAQGRGRDDQHAATPTRRSSRRTSPGWRACIGDDRQQAYLLTDYWYRKLDLKRVAIIRSSNRYGRFGVREIRDSARRMGRPVPIEMAYKVGQKDFRLEVERVKNAKPDAVVHWGDAVEGALVLNTMREMGMTQPFFGCDRTVSEEFVKIAGQERRGRRGRPTPGTRRAGARGSSGSGRPTRSATGSRRTPTPRTPTTA